MTKLVTQLLELSCCLNRGQRETHARVQVYVVSKIGMSHMSSYRSFSLEREAIFLCTSLFVTLSAYNPSALRTPRLSSAGMLTGTTSMRTITSGTAEGH